MLCFSFLTSDRGAAPFRVQNCWLVDVSEITCLVVWLTFCILIPQISISKCKMRKCFINMCELMIVSSEVIRLVINVCVLIPRIVLSAPGNSAYVHFSLAVAHGTKAFTFCSTENTFEVSPFPKEITITTPDEVWTCSFTLAGENAIYWTNCYIWDENEWRRDTWY